MIINWDIGYELSEVRNAHRMNQRQVRVWHLSERVRRKTSLLRKRETK